MKALGLDIGTSTISAVILEGGVVVCSRTVDNDSAIFTPNPWERLQDPQRILGKVRAVAGELLTLYPDTACIGFTGQQHGIVYLDGEGNALSPLHTWQDGRGDQIVEGGETYAQRLSALTGYAMSTGFGLTTHYYNLLNGLVPERAEVFCTIHDYAAMKLAGLKTPKTDASDGASFGLFDVKNGCFDLATVRKAGIDPAILPEVAAEPLLGTGEFGLPVYAAIGDNQASFLGSVGELKNCMLVNVGTGGQFSVHTDAYMTCEGLETRPYPAGGYLLVGSSLCGGRAYAMLENFFRAAAGAMTGEDPGSCYDAMARLAGDGEAENIPEVTPLFQGTRENPQLRGSIAGLGTDNFTPRHLLLGLMRGMARELGEMYERYRNAGGSSAILIGSGNGLRKNAQLCRCFEKEFGLPLQLSLQREEAACGAAGYALLSYR